MVRTVHTRTLHIDYYETSRLEIAACNGNRLNKIKIVYDANSKVSSKFHFISLTSQSPLVLHLLHLKNISRDCCKMAFKRSKGNFKFQGKILVLCQVFLLGGDIAIGRAEGEVKPFAKELRQLLLAEMQACTKSLISN